MVSFAKNQLLHLHLEEEAAGRFANFSSIYIYLTTLVTKKLWIVNYNPKLSNKETYAIIFPLSFQLLFLPP